jgi:hypothetical protein
VSDGYRDPNIECTESALRIRAYYFPWGTKVIPYGSIKGLKRVDMGLATGRARVWGTANPRYWASLDTARPSKKVAFIVDVGKHVSPYVTPDDPDAFEAALRESAHLGPGAAAAGGPII